MCHWPHRFFFPRWLGDHRLYHLRHTSKSKEKCGARWTRNVFEPAETTSLVVFTDIVTVKAVHEDFATWSSS